MDVMSFSLSLKEGKCILEHFKEKSNLQIKGDENHRRPIEVRVIYGLCWLPVRRKCYSAKNIEELALKRKKAAFYTSNSSFQTAHSFLPRARLPTFWIMVAINMVPENVQIANCNLKCVCVCTYRVRHAAVCIWRRQVPRVVSLLPP